MKNRSFLYALTCFALGWWLLGAGAMPVRAETTTGTVIPSRPSTETVARELQNLPPLPADSTEGLRFNFRGVTLDTVLDYLSRAAGFVVIRDAKPTGTVDVVSHQPLNADEAVMLLNTILSQKGFAAIRNERTLTIVKREEARMRDLPVRMGSDPASIPKTDEMVIQIIPVRRASAGQLMQNLQPLLPSNATMSANESTNAIILTDTQTNIRRIAEIIQALDKSVSTASAMKVYTIRRANASELATLINTLFGSQAGGSRFGSSADREQQIRDFISRMRGGGPGGGPGGFPGGGPGGFPGGGPGGFPGGPPGGGRGGP